MQKLVSGVVDARVIWTLAKGILEKQKLFVRAWLYCCFDDVKMKVLSQTENSSGLLKCNLVYM